MWTRQLFTSSNRSWNLGSETLERCRSFTVFLRASGPVEVILSSFAGVWLLLVGLPCECLDGSSESWVASAGWSELEDGRETSELDGDGGWGSCRVGDGDGDGHSRLVVTVNSGFLESSSVVTVSSGKWFNLSDTRQYHYLSRVNY